MSTHPYRPLADSGEIRVIRLKPGHGDDPILCTLGLISFASPEIDAYNAISYAWESQVPTESIILGGNDFLVTYNVFSALKHFRQDQQSKSLWIDAVCINQQDTDERGHQVSQMRSVYRNARNVVIWLGDASDDMRDAFSHVKNGHIGMDDECPDSFWQMIQKPWWKRIWVLQEVVAAKEPPILKCGHDELAWEELNGLKTGDGPRVWFGPLLRVKKLTGHVHLFVQVVEQLRQSNGRLSWAEFFSLRLSLQATDPRDYTYALLGLMPLDVQDRISVDYNLESDGVFRLTAQAAALTGLGVDLLTHLAMSSFNASNLAGTAWCPSTLT